MARKHWLILWCAVGAAALFFDMRHHIRHSPAVAGRRAAASVEVDRTARYEVVHLRPLLGDVESRAASVDGAGRVLGYSSTPGGTTPSVRWLIWQGGVGTAASHDQIIGFARPPRKGPLWERRVRELRAVAGKTESDPGRINRKGEMIGTAALLGRKRRAFLFSGRTLTALRDLPGAQGSRATGINDLGAVVGTTHLRQGYETQDWRATLWRDGQVVDLGQQIPRGSGWMLQEAYDINDRGQIVGSGYFEGRRRAFLLNPR